MFFCLIILTNYIILDTIIKNYQKMKSNSTETVLSKWLNKLQEESWNLELLISGFAIFGLFRLADFIQLKFALIHANPVENLQSAWIMTSLLSMSAFGVYIFILCLLIHVFLRGLWIGAIGLRYVSGQINYDNFKYNPIFKVYLKKKTGNFDNFILKLEKISSIIFSLTYLLFFIVLSFFLYLIELGYIAGMAAEHTNNFIAKFLAYLLLLPGIIVGFDFITLGLLKRIKTKWISTIYLWLYAFIGYITLSFLWRPILYNFIDQKNAKKIVVCAFPLLIIIGFFASTYMSSYSLYPKLKTEYRGNLFESIYYKENARQSFTPEFYDDLREDLKEDKQYCTISILSLPTYRIEDPVLEVFIKHDSQTDKVIMKIDSTIIPIEQIGFNNGLSKKSDFDKLLSSKNKTFKAAYNKLLSTDTIKAELLRIKYIEDKQNAYHNNVEKLKMAIKESFSIDINDNEVDKANMNIDFFVHSNFGEQGYICNFPLEEVHQGTNYLTLRRKIYNKKLNEIRENDITIPFIYVGNVK